MENKLLNLGCGQRYHADWVNVDFYSDKSEIISANLINGIPFPNESFDVVYHSHVLEHFSKNNGISFIKECHRVLKPGGIIRVVVPDLRSIIKEYVRISELMESGKQELEADYDWILLELFDQMIRNESGGDMAKYLAQQNLKNEDFIIKRMGEGFRDFRNLLLQQKSISVKNIFAKKITFRKLVNWIKKNVPNKEYKIGHFRLGGEIHQWMYDAYSLERLLNKCDFENAKVMTANSSRIKNWEHYALDFKDGKIYKADSLFMEANKSIN